MEFTVAGEFWGDKAVITWEDGELSGSPQHVVDEIKRLDNRDLMVLGGQPFVFDLSEFEIAYMFITEYYVDKATVVGDKPEEDPDNVY